MLLELHAVKKYFPLRSGLLRRTKNYVRAVDDVTLTLSPGVNLGLVGESGSGKTTLGRLILKLYQPDAGRIIFKGQDVTGLSSSAMRPWRRYMQMIFQDPYSSLDPRYTIRELLQEALSPEDKKQMSSSSREDKMRALLSTVGLKGEMLNRFPHEFSGGERQRVAMARALMSNPELLILDEAVSSLDVLVQDQIIELLKQIQQQYGLTYLFISHNLRVVRRLCQRVAVMYQGKIVELAPAPALFADPQHPYTRQLLAAAMDYRVLPAQEFKIAQNSHLIDKGNGHFVID